MFVPIVWLFVKPGTELDELNHTRVSNVVFVGTHVAGAAAPAVLGGRMSPSGNGAAPSTVLAVRNRMN